MLKTIKNLLRRTVPPSIKRPIAEILHERKRRKFAADLLSKDILVPADEMAVMYGGCTRPGPAGILHGGRVKLTHLESIYPEVPNKANILYMVSSAVPEFAEELVLWAKGKGVKFVWNQNGIAYPAWAGNSYSGINQRLSGLMRLADFVVYQSEFCKQSADRYLGESKVPHTIIYNCVDTDIFRPSEKFAVKGPLVLVAAGSHQQAERVLQVLAVVAELKKRGMSIRLVLAGRLDWPDADPQVLETVAKLGIGDDLEFYPSYSQEQAPDIYRLGHILLHPKYKDPCPTVVIEAIACGLPVVGSRSGGMYELLGDEAGVLVEVLDSWEIMHYPAVEDIADAVVKISNDLGRWREQARRRAVERFGKDVFLARHREVFEQVLR